MKKFKETYIWKPTDWDETVKINERAKELAAEFNDAVSTNKAITFTDVHVMKVTGRSDLHSAPRPNEYVTCEDFIPGTFNKWCNNYGYISTESATQPAFMHWSWYHTDGEEMIADLQGVRNPDSFTLTDPAIISLSESYGATDVGVEGMAMFFLHHKCSSYCRDLPAPTLAHFPPAVLGGRQDPVSQSLQLHNLQDGAEISTGHSWSCGTKVPRNCQKLSRKEQILITSASVCNNFFYSQGI